MRLTKSNQRRIMTIMENKDPSDSQGIMIDESKVIERGGLGGKTISSSSTGSMKKQILIPICHVCGRKLGDYIAVCEECGNPCSPECVVNFDGISRCLKCLQLGFPKKFFKILFCVFLPARKIHRATGIAKEEVKSVLIEFLRNGIVTYKGLILHHFELTDKGREIFHLYSQVYRERDVQDIQEWLSPYARKGCLLED